MGTGAFIPEVWSKRLVDQFAAAVIFGSSAMTSYMFGRTPLADRDEVIAMPEGPEKQQAWIDWHCEYGRWKRVFAWKPVHTERSRKWLTHVMQSRYVPQGPYSDPLHLTVAGYVAYRLDGKIAK